MSISHYKAVLTAAGPVFIGSGEETKKFEYAYESRTKTVYVIDTLKMFRLLTPQQLERFETHIGENRNLTEFFERIGIVSEQYGKAAHYRYISPEDPNNQNIKAFIKNAYGQPYIPGSSLKGAVRTAILYKIIEEHYNSSNPPKVPEDIMKNVRYSEKERDPKQKKPYLRQMNYLADDYEMSVINTLDVDSKHPKSGVNSIMRGLRISDSEPLKTSDLCLCKKIDIMPDGETAGRKTSPPVLRECLRPGTSISFDIDIDEKLLGHDAVFLDSSFDAYYDVQEWQMSAFTKHPTIEAKKGIHYIVLGGGSGYVSKTFTYPLMPQDDDMDLRTVSQIMQIKFPGGGHRKDLDYGVSPHTRKMTVFNGKYYDFGVCRIELQNR